MDLDQCVRAAMEALNGGDSDGARQHLHAALELDPKRPDLMHALGALELQRGAPGEARPLVERALALLDAGEVPEAAAMRPHFQQSLANIAEAEDRPGQAEAAYRSILAEDPKHIEALAGLGKLQMACCELDKGLATLQVALSGGAATPEVMALRDFAHAVRAFPESGRPARQLLEVHREAYCEFFDHHVAQMEPKGWIAEAARMRRGADGSLVPDIPEGARPYAAVRVDLVNPATGQAGLVGDRPMLAALPGLEALARTAICYPWADLPFELFVSTQAPWDHLPVQIMLEQGDPLELVDPLVGRWYRQGYDGQFGTDKGGRFHFVSPPERRGPAGVVYTLDMGRARIQAIDALVEALVSFHRERPLRRVILGRGHLPEDGGK